MPLIGLHCHFGVTPGAMAVRPPDLSQAITYANEHEVETLCFSSEEAATDLDGGNARLDDALNSDARFRGWLALSVHQPDMSQELARYYLTRARFIGARFVQQTEGDVVDV